jgi:hypothetical protein
MIRDANERRSALRICLVATGLAKGAATNPVDGAVQVAGAILKLGPFA